MRAKAHHLDPVVMIGQHGLTPPVLHEIDLALTAHELIKVRVQSESRVERQALLAAICAALDCAPVQHLGKLLIVWRANPAKHKDAGKAKPSPAGKARPSQPSGPRGTKAATANGKAKAEPTARDAAAERRKRRNAQGGKAGNVTLPYFSRRGAGRFVADTPEAPVSRTADTAAPAPRDGASAARRPKSPSPRRPGSPVSRRPGGAATRRPATPESRPPAGTPSRRRRG